MPWLLLAEKCHGSLLEHLQTCVVGMVLRFVVESGPGINTVVVHDGVVFIYRCQRSKYVTSLDISSPPATKRVLSASNLFSDS